MNNDISRRDKTTKDGYQVVDADVEKAYEPAPEETAHLAKKIYVLGKLLKNPDFRFFLKEFIEPRLRDAEQKLRTSIDIELFRAQGSVRELEFMTDDLPSTLQALKNTVDHGTQETQPEG